MTKDIEAEIKEFEKLPEGMTILKQVILAKGVDKIDYDDIEELKEIACGIRPTIPKEKMQMMVDFGLAKPVDYCRFEGVFRIVAHVTYHQGKKGWTPLPENFYKYQ